jgi:hypothetical protein
VHDLIDFGLTVLGVGYALCAVVTLVGFCWLGRTDTDEPAAADAPDADDEAAEQATEVLGFQRAKPFTGTEEAVISDLDIDVLVGDIAAAVEAYRSGVEIWADAVREMAP